MNIRGPSNPLDGLGDERRDNEDLDAPDLDAPDLDAPDLDAPDLDAPDLDAPDLDAPDLDALDADPSLDDELTAGLEAGFALMAQGSPVTPSVSAIGAAAPRPAPLAPMRKSDDVDSVPIAPPRLRGQSRPLQVWGSAEFHDIARTLQTITDAWKQDLHGAVAQETRMLRHALSTTTAAILALAATLQDAEPGAAAAQAARDAAAPEPVASQEGLVAAAASLHEAAKACHAETIRLVEPISVRLTHYFDEDPVMLALEAAIAGLETLPAQFPVLLEVTAERDLGLAGRILAKARLRRTLSQWQLPVRRVVSMVVAKVGLAKLEAFFPLRHSLRWEVDAALDRVVSVAARVARDASGEPESVDPARGGDGDHAPRGAAALQEAAAQLDGPLESLARFSDRLNATIDEVRAALDEIPVLTAETAALRGDVRVRWESLGYGLRHALRRSLAQFSAAHRRRLHHRVLHEERVRKALPDLTRQVQSTLGELRQVLEDDLQHHRDTMAPLEEALSRSRERLAEVFVDTKPSVKQRHRALRRTTTRQLKQVYRVQERRVAIPLKQRYQHDPIHEALASGYLAVRSIAHSVGKIELVFPRPQTPGSRFLMWLRLATPERRFVVPLNAVVRKWLILRRFWELEALEDERRVMREDFLTSITEVWNITRYNLEGPLAEVEELLDPAHPIADDDEDVLALCESGRLSAVAGIERAITRTHALLAELEAFAERVVVVFSEKLDFAEQVRADVGDIAHIGGRFKHRGSSTRLWLREKIRRGGLYLRHVAGDLVGHAGRLGVYVSLRSRGIREALGLVTAEAAAHALPSDEAIAEHLVRAWDHIPAVYRRLFSFEPLDFDEFMVGREQALATMHDAASRWQRGERSAVLLQGNPGTGKRSLLNVAMDRSLPEASISRVHLTLRVHAPNELLRALCTALELPLQRSIDELERALLALPRRVIVLEGTAKLFLRSIGGFEALNQFLLLVTRTSRHHLWIVFLEAHTHALLQRLWRVEDAFSHVIETGEITPQLLREAIRTRHEPSGFALEFEADPETTARYTRDIRRVRNDPRALQEIFATAFFEKLHAISGDNLFVALFYWLRSIDTVEENSIRLGPLRAMEFPSIARLDQDTLFAAAAILQHGSLDTDELTRLFGWSGIKSRLILQHLEHHFITLPSDVDARPEGVEASARQHVNPLMLTPLVVALQRRHIVYW